MQLRNFAFAAVLSTVGFMMAGCPEDAVTSTTCSTNADCVADSEVCNTAAGVCMQTCTEESDCPGDTFACGAMASTGGVRVCQCSTDAGCNADRETADLICNQDNGACVQRCTSDSACGVGGICDLTTGVCGTGGVGSTCSGEGLSTCTYGNICTANACAAPPTPTCSNYTNMSADRKATLGTSGPIIFATSIVSSALDSNFCTSSAPKRVRMKVSAYNDEDFQDAFTKLNGFFYILVNGQPATNVRVSDRSDSYVRSENNRRVDFVLEFCEASAQGQLQTGVYFTGGNFLCSTHSI